MTGFILAALLTAVQPAAASDLECELMARVLEHRIADPARGSGSVVRLASETLSDDGTPEVFAAHVREWMTGGGRSFPREMTREERRELNTLVIRFMSDWQAQRRPMADAARREARTPDDVERWRTGVQRELSNAAVAAHAFAVRFMGEFRIMADVTALEDLRRAAHSPRRIACSGIAALPELEISDEEVRTQPSLKMTRPGFSADGRQAVIRVSGHSGTDADGRWSFAEATYLLERVGGRWVVAAHRTDRRGHG